jgi:hypothetical protein
MAALMAGSEQTISIFFKLIKHYSTTARTGSFTNLLLAVLLAFGSASTKPTGVRKRAGLVQASFSKD